MITLSVIADDDRKRILEASFQILEETGVQVDHPRVFRLLCEAGCRGDDEKRRIFFPRLVVREKLALCPSTLTLADRKENLMVAVPGGNSYLYTGDALNIIDGKQTRPIEETDFIQFCRVVEALPNIQGVVSANIREVPAYAKDFVAFRIMLENTTKHLRPVIYSPQGAEIIVEMANVVAEETGHDLRSKPILTVGHSISSPLRWLEKGLEAFCRTAGYGIPAQINSQCIAGATSPVTLSGTLALANAQALSGVVINQVLEPGRPCLYTLGFSHVMDMRTGEPTTGAPENGLLGAAGAEFAKDLGLPSAAWTCSDSACVDSQSAFERGLVLLLMVLGGTNIVWGAGNLESTKAMSLEQAVIDDEIFGAILRVQRGIVVSEEALAVKHIDEMGSYAGYLASDFTLKHFRQEIATFKLLNRHKRSAWEARGSKSLEEVARDEVARILRGSPPQCIDPGIGEKIRLIEKKWLEKLARSERSA
jgi:trimethylamine---corrinoid protein Co-methyltransferase